MKSRYCSRAGHRAQAGLGKKRESRSRCVGHELVEVHGIVGLAHVVVGQDGVAALADMPHFLAQGGLDFVLACERRGYDRNERARRGQPRRRVGYCARVVLEHLPYRAASVAAGQCVVAHEGNALRSEVARNERQHVGAHVRWDP